MEDIQKLYHACKPCRQTGTVDYVYLENGDIVPGTKACLLCRGEGKHSNTWLSDDLVDLFNDMNDKINDILEKVNE